MGKKRFGKKLDIMNKLNATKVRLNNALYRIAEMETRDEHELSPAVEAEINRQETERKQKRYAIKERLQEEIALVERRAKEPMIDAMLEFIMEEASREGTPVQKRSNNALYRKITNAVTLL